LPLFCAVIINNYKPKMVPEIMLAHLNILTNGTKLSS